MKKPTTLSIQLITIITIAILLLPAACGTEDPTQTPSGALRPLTIATLPAMDSVPVFIARDMGFFEAEGLHVNIQPFFSGGDRDMAFQADNSIDGLLTDLVAINIFREGGIDIRAAVSTIGITSVVGRSNHMEDLRGQDVLITFNTAMEYVIDRALAHASMTMADIQPVSVPPLPTRLELLLAGSAAGAVMPEPFVSLAVDEGLVEIVSSHQLNINPFTIAFRQAVVEGYQLELEAFYRAINNAINFLNSADREEFIDIIIQEVGYPQHVRDTLVVPNFPRYAVPSYRHVEDVVDFAYSRGLISQQFAPEVLVADISPRS